MQEPGSEVKKTKNSDPKMRVEHKSNAPDVLVCIGEQMPESGPFSHAQLLAKAMGGKMVLLHVIETPKLEKAPFDPVDWDIQRREAKAALARVARHIETGDDRIETRLLEGRPVEQICAAVSKKLQDITAVFRQPGEPGWNIDDTARNVVERASGSMLMIPAQLDTGRCEHYSKIIVPLDGSARGESAVPKAVRLAKANDAELILCHVALEPQMSAMGPKDYETLDLKKQTVGKNKSFGQNYLNRLGTKMTNCGVRASTLVVDGSDARRTLLKIIDDQNADLVVMASHGHSGHTDVPMGDVAGFLVSRSPVPVLMVRQARRFTPSHIFSSTRAQGVRPPSGSVQ
jgi:nucleotide-binding universal stress UspA family protein